MKTVITLALLFTSLLGYSQSPDPVDSLGNLNEHFILQDIYFDYNKWTIRPESFPILDTLALFLVTEDSTLYEVQSHTDCRGSASYSIRLSQKRAESVRQYLIEKGVPANRLIAKGYDEDQPRVLEDGTILTCDYISKLETVEQKEMHHQMNRRIEILRLR